MQPTIALTTYGRYEKDLATVYHKYQFSVPAPYIDAIRRAGGLPLLLPPGEEDWDTLLSSVDGILVTGGADISPAIYGGDNDHAALTRLDPERDQSELTLIRTLVANAEPRIRTMPLLCVCRGMQVLNVALGGSLYEHVAEIRGQDIHRGASGGWSTHAIDVLSSSLAATAMETTTISTHSGHHQAIKDVAPGLTISATAPDGIIEAVEHEELPWVLGVQWHPESTAHTDPTQQRLFDAFTGAAAAHKSRWR